MRFSLASILALLAVIVGLTMGVPPADTEATMRLLRNLNRYSQFLDDLDLYNDSPIKRASLAGPRPLRFG
ncbi:hypothetical protein PRIPAC_71070 [Pristionchus pacificus]|uniref:Uncharacterized protein n=1 Tax=Pristionchus pacificus TaxID=54126 RepID=A0A2A6C9M8_PRIPA|nr:hypothetical protein PRIPAC_71070 [Pristionchus pacificus]|eukprot:PDM74915.1 hypothetical protein PRIPAC_40296 [Pristionchus pacificus]